MSSASDIKALLNLSPNPIEGGYLYNAYQSPITIPNKTLPGYPKPRHARSLCGAIYYFLEGFGCSILHRVTGDMLYHFYNGDPVQMLLLHPERSSPRTEVCVFGSNLALGQKPLKAIPGGTWMGSRLMPGGSWALMGVTMSPGFDPADYEVGSRATLVEQYPEQAALIAALTR